MKILSFVTRSLCHSKPICCYLFICWVFSCSSFSYCDSYQLFSM